MPFGPNCYRLRLKLLFFLFISLSGLSQELPPVINFDPVEYDGGNQNWMITQGPQRYIYIANSSGLLEYNGADWHLYPVPNKTIVRSVEAVGSRIFTGAYMEVGFWQRNQAGVLEYTSLLPRFPRAVHDGEQFWHIEHVDNTVVFQSFEGLYLYDIPTNRLRVLEVPSGSISNLFRSQQEIYFQVSQQGLFKVEKGAAKNLIPFSALGNREVVQVIGEGENTRIITRSAEFFSWNGRVLKPYNEHLSRELEDISLFSALELTDGSLLLGSVENGLYHINANGKMLHHLNQENGLQNNTILTLYLDDKQNAWAGLDNGISVLNLNSPFRLFQDNVGRIGTVYASLAQGNYLYLGTNQGLYFRRKGENRYHFVDGTNGQVWSLQHHNGTIFIGHNNGTFVVEGETARKISARLGTWTVKPLPGMENWFLQGHYNGISLLQKQGQEFKDFPMIPDFPHSSKHIVVKGDGTIWISNEHKGIFRFNLDEDLQGIRNVQNYAFDDIIGITSSIFNFDDCLYFSTKNRIFRYDPIQNRFEEAGELSEIFEGVERISGRIISFGSDLWGFSQTGLFNVYSADLQNDLQVNHVLIPKELRTIPQGYENITELEDGSHLLGLVDGYLVFDDYVGDALEDYEVLMDRITISGREESLISVPLDKAISLEYDNNNISFHFSIPEYKKFLSPMYSYKLEGLNLKWSQWHQEPQADFKNLSAGDYTFVVRGRLGEKVIGQKSYSFEVLRPWYFSNLALAAYFILLCLLILLVHWRYRKEHEKRIREHEKTLKLKNLEAEQRIIRLQNERLEQEMENKNKELAISTMSLIKKNEFLTSIKDRLKDSEDSSNKIRSVIRTIDKDISEEDNWKFFKKAFSNADKDFFRKIKEKHPDLTPNDLKLCAYLRLNLSSKEIAPLLNISVKSVEIKRYRLRKKMGLGRETNLTDYIMDL